MRRLWVRLSLAFVLVTLVSVAAAALFANQQTSAQFRGFLAQNQLQESGIIDVLLSYYQKQGSWQGVEQVFASWHGPGAGQGAGRGQMRGATVLILTDHDGTLLYDSSLVAKHSGQPQTDLAPIPLVVNGSTVGFLQARVVGQSGMSAAAERFLAQINLALLQAAGIGILLGAIIGLLVARSLSAPLASMASAARQLAQGDHTQRVALRGPLEVQAASTAFNDMAAALEQAEGQRQRMIADIAHELRTPLAVIQGNLQALLEDVYPLEKDEIQTIFDETLLLSRLVDDLRELALAEAGQLRLELQSVDMQALLIQSIAIFQGPIAEKGLDLHISVPEQLPLVWADPARSSQIVRNLLANALRYTPPGGTISLRAKLGQGSGQTSSACVVIEIEDSGPGMTEAELAHVFERFWRADRARTRSQGGTGLGLAIAQQLVEAQGGQIGVQSRVGQGSCFWFSLPYRAA